MSSDCTEKLSKLYRAMTQAYQQAHSKEVGAIEALQIYQANTQEIDEISRVLDEIRDLRDLLTESLRRLQEERSKKEKRTITLRGKGSLVVKLVPCGKHCSGCPHGPYAYEVHREGGKQIWKYLGRAKSVDPQISESKHLQVRYPPGHEPRQ